MSEKYPLPEIVAAMRRLNERLQFTVSVNALHYEKWSAFGRREVTDLSYYESWLHEVGHLIALTGSVRVPVGTSGRDYLDELLSARYERYGDRNEARALSIEHTASKLFGYHVSLRRVVNGASTFVIKLPELWRWVRRDQAQGKTTPIYARRIYNIVVREIRKERMKIKIGDIEFSTKKAAAEYCSDLLKNTLPGAPVDETTKTFLTALLGRHPKAKEKVGGGIKDFHVVQQAYSRCFFVERVDGTVEDFSYTKCLGG